MFRRPASDSEDEDYCGGPSSSKKNEIESSLERVISGRNAREPSEEPPPAKGDEEEAQQEVISRDDLNKMAAKVLKAELKGDMEKAAKLSEKLERARKAFETTNSSTIMLEVDRRTGTAKPAGFKTRHDRAREAEHEMLSKFISRGDRTEQEIKKREDRRARKRGPETEQDRMNRFRQNDSEPQLVLAKNGIIEYSLQKFVSSCWLKILAKFSANGHFDC
ncbi:hypothetical protein FO519_000381 [Halicephalobus sp. NKZ332]|nr:hypothetical protein FO519_000381 [Halicephalobus sp. NKZ332]